MRCISCGANIPPEWVHSIQSNICPGCGNNIMNQETMELLSELSQAMEKMPNDPQGVAGWLLSNYRFKKMGDCTPVEKFHREGIDKDADKAGIISHQAKNEFNKVIEKNNKIKEKKYKKLVSYINETEQEDDNVDENIDIDDVKYYNELKSQGMDPFGENSSSNEIFDAESLNALGAIATNGIINSKDDIFLSQGPEGRAFLEKIRQKQKEAAESITNREGGGIFRR